MWHPRLRWYEATSHSSAQPGWHWLHRVPEEMVGEYWGDFSRKTSIRRTHPIARSCAFQISPIVQQPAALCTSSDALRELLSLHFLLKMKDISFRAGMGKGRVQLQLQSQQAPLSSRKIVSWLLAACHCCLSINHGQWLMGVCGASSESQPGGQEMAPVLSTSAPLGGMGSRFGRQSAQVRWACSCQCVLAGCSKAGDRKWGVEHWFPVSIWSSERGWAAVTALPSFQTSFNVSYNSSYLCLLQVVYNTLRL